MAGRALDVVRIQRVVNTCWLSESLGQLPAIARQMGERGTERHGERGSFGGGGERAITEGPAFHQQLIRALHRPQEDFQRWTNEAVCPQTSGCRPRRVITQATVRE